MKQNNYIYAIIEVLILVVVLLVACTVLNSEYLFGWAAHNWKFYLVLSSTALLFLFLNKRLVSAFMTIGITTGIFVGNYLGALIKTYNESKILDGMKAEEIYRLRHHPGFEIWIGIILLFIVIGAIMQITVKKKRANI
ncbi:conserved membrane hypothetical protein [[Clostridium] ultunense Esp]|uniref:Uncharacterized protein n=1 Tax=[Clostridium] ultunense Esp TaxID=1288971 RepID=M1Z7W1_9FIRM|nr:hypothetical protein [Schnuerera ultunensis]CCQ93819.1 conserved membrane hypothetical protein [[Clostridium] ultunense Esp]SHD78095.1 conserved membrane protein of unknown function [[Clostridium] ultunense Esp]